METAFLGQPLEDALRRLAAVDNAEHLRMLLQFLCQHVISQHARLAKGHTPKAFLKPHRLRAQLRYRMLRRKVFH